MSAVTRFDNIKDIPPAVIAEQRAGKWNSWTRVLVYQTEDQKITVIRAEWYERMLAAFLKLFGCDYFAKVFDGKRATLMTPDKVDAAFSKIGKPGGSDAPKELSLAATKLQALWKLALTADPVKEPGVWQNFFDSVQPVLQENGNNNQAIYDLTIGAWDASINNYLRLYQALREQGLGDRLGDLFKKWLRIELQEKYDLVVCLVKDQPQPKFCSLQSLYVLLGVLEAEASGADWSQSRKFIISALSEHKELDIDGKLHQIFDDLKSGVLWQSNAQRASTLVAWLVDAYDRKPTLVVEVYLKKVLSKMDQTQADALMKPLKPTSPFRKLVEEWKARLNKLAEDEKALATSNDKAVGNLAEG